MKLFGFVGVQGMRFLGSDGVIDVLLVCLNGGAGYGDDFAAGDEAEEEAGGECDGVEEDGCRHGGLVWS